MDIKAIKLLVKLFCKQKKHSQAEDLINKSLELMPDEADLYYLLAGIHKQLENNEEYEKFIKITYDKKITFTGDEKVLEEEIKKISL